MSEQAIRFTTVSGRRVAWATVGSGPPLVIGGWWMSHLELDWRDPGFRAFVEALAEHRTVIRYDRPGTGLSADGESPPVGLDAELEVLSGMADALDSPDFDVFAASSGGPVAAAYAAAEPERIRRIVLYGSYADGAEIADEAARRALVEVVRGHWGLGSRVLADAFMPTADGVDRAAFARFQRASASPEVAASSLEAVYSFSVLEELSEVRTPTLVLHRRGDRAIPFALGQDLASRIANARFVALEGSDHLPWRGATAELAALILEGLGVANPDVTIADRRPEAVETVAATETDLSDRELEVLRLIALGFSDREIAEQLVLSPHTVHRHAANIRAKLRLPSRAAAAAHAGRMGLL